MSGRGDISGYIPSEGLDMTNAFSHAAEPEMEVSQPQIYSQLSGDPAQGGVEWALRWKWKDGHVRVRPCQIVCHNLPANQLESLPGGKISKGQTEPMTGVRDFTAFIFLCFPRSKLERHLWSGCLLEI